MPSDGSSADGHLFSTPWLQSMHGQSLVLKHNSRTQCLKWATRFDIKKRRTLAKSQPVMSFIMLCLLYYAMCLLCHTLAQPNAMFGQTDILQSRAHILQKVFYCLVKKQNKLEHKSVKIGYEAVNGKSPVADDMFYSAPHFTTQFEVSYGVAMLIPSIHTTFIQSVSFLSASAHLALMCLKWKTTATTTGCMPEMSNFWMHINCDPLFQPNTKTLSTIHCNS